MIQWNLPNLTLFRMRKLVGLERLKCRRGTSFSKVVRRKNSCVLKWHHLCTKSSATIQVIILLVFVYIINPSICGYNIRIDCLVHQFMLVFSRFFPYAFCIVINPPIFGDQLEKWCGDSGPGMPPLKCIVKHSFVYRGYVGSR